MYGTHMGTRETENVRVLSGERHPGRGVKNTMHTTALGEAMPDIRTVFTSVSSSKSARKASTRTLCLVLSSSATRSPGLARTAFSAVWVKTDQRGVLARLGQGSIEEPCEQVCV